MSFNGHFAAAYDWLQNYQQFPVRYLEIIGIVTPSLSNVKTLNERTDKCRMKYS